MYHVFVPAFIPEPDLLSVMAIHCCRAAACSRVVLSDLNQSVHPIPSKRSVCLRILHVCTGEKKDACHSRPRMVHYPDEIEYSERYQEKVLWFFNWSFRPCPWLLLPVCFAG